MNTRLWRVWHWWYGEKFVVARFRCPGSALLALERYQAVTPNLRFYLDDEGQP